MGSMALWVAAAEPSPVQTSTSMEGLSLPAPGPWYSGGEEVCQAAEGGHAAEVDAGSQAKEGNRQIYKYSEAPKRLSPWLQDYPSSF